MENKGFYKTISETFGIATTAFVLQGLEAIITWLVVMFAVIACEMITSVRCKFLLGEKIKIGRIFNLTISKIVTYFSFVVMGVFLNLATKGEYNIDKWLILFLCVVEILLIVGNLLKPLGFSVDLGGAIGVFLKKVFGIDKEDSRDIIKKDHVTKKTKKTDHGKS